MPRLAAIRMESITTIVDPLLEETSLKAPNLREGGHPAGRHNARALVRPARCPSKYRDLLLGALAEVANLCKGQVS
jgi:hypothetical protein